MKPDEHDRVRTEIEGVKKRLEETTQEFIRFAVETYIRQHHGDLDEALSQFLWDVKKHHSSHARPDNYMDGPRPNPIERDIVSLFLLMKDSTGRPL